MSVVRGNDIASIVVCPIAVAQTRLSFQAYWMQFKIGNRPRQYQSRLLHPTIGSAYQQAMLCDLRFQRDRLSYLCSYEQDGIGITGNERQAFTHHSNNPAYNTSRIFEFVSLAQPSAPSSFPHCLGRQWSDSSRTPFKCQCREYPCTRCEWSIFFCTFTRPEVYHNPRFCRQDSR